MTVITSTRTITRTDLLNEITHLDLTRRNPYCVYTNTNGEHCIAAQMLVNLNVNVPNENTRDDHDYDLNTRGIRALINDGWFSSQGVQFDLPAIEFLDAVQVAADGYDDPDTLNDGAPRVTWEYAVIEAKNELGIA
jgi:hypothetical protein